MIRQTARSVGDYGANSHGPHDEVSSDRWLVSYADFMTLLMAFFVVMYSISQVSEQKYRVLSETFTQAFNPTSKTEIVVSEGDPQRSHTLTPIDMDGHALQDRPGNDANDVPESFVRITEQLEQSFQSLIDSELITVTGNERWLQIELPSAILFDSGGADLSEPAASIIGELTAALEQYGNVIRVEGFTDNVPIQTSQFTSNWELSAARATAVVRLMESQGVDPNRLAAVGYGEHQPAASNATEAGRAKNRRIVLMVSTSESLRPHSSQVDELIVDGSSTISRPVIDGLVAGLDVSARAQAEAWFGRLTSGGETAAPIDDQANAEPVSTLVGAFANAQSESEAVDAASENKTIAVGGGVKQVELSNGALLFTGEDN